MSTATSLFYRTHLRPRQVSSGIRHKLARELNYEQTTWSALIVCVGAIFALSVVFIFNERGMDGTMQREAVRPVFFAVLFALLFIHAHYRRLRNFVMEAPATAALVVREKTPPHFDEETSLAVPQLLLRYLPRPGEEEIDPYVLHHAPDAHTLWAELDGFSARFERTVHAGDYVSILYDPTDPEHVRVVEIDIDGRAPA